MKEKYFIIILALMIVSTVVAVGFVLWNNRNLPAQTIAKIQKEANPCLGLSASAGERSCEDALAKVRELYPGKVNSAQLAITHFQEGPQGEPKDIEIWLVDINLENPIETPAGSMKRVTIGVDTTYTNTNKPFIEQFFAEAL